MDRVQFYPMAEVDWICADTKSLRLFRKIVTFSHASNSLQELGLYLLLTHNKRSRNSVKCFAKSVSISVAMIFHDIK